MSAPAMAGAPSWCSLGVAWALAVLAVIAVAGGVHLVFGGWLEGTPTRDLPNSAVTVADIFTNNLLICLCPAFGGWLAAGHLAAGRRLAASLFVALPTVIVLRSLITIGAVGGGDPTWFVDASRWWLLELLALATSARTGVVLARHPERRDADGPAAMRRTVAVTVAALALGALIEVFTA